MKKQKKLTVVAIVAAVALIAGGVYFYQNKAQEEFTSQNAVITIDRPDLGLQFGYMAGPDALSMVEPPVSGLPLLGAFIIMPSVEYVAFSNGEDQDVGPTISLFVFRYSDEEMSAEVQEYSKRDKLLAWAQENQSLTGINTATTELEDFEVDGLKGVSYKTESTYMHDIKLFRLGDRQYMFVGQSESEEDEMIPYFEDVLASVSFE